METNVPILLIDSHCGIYMINEFCKRFNKPENFVNYKEIEEKLFFLSDEKNIENEDYWEIVDEFMNMAILLNTEKEKFYLCFNEDLWAVPENFDTENWFI